MVLPGGKLVAKQFAMVFRDNPMAHIGMQMYCPCGLHRYIYETFSSLG